MVTAIAYVMGLTFGLSIWWIERKRRLLWRDHSDWQKGHMGKLHDLLTQSIGDTEEARYQAEGYRDAFLSLEDTDAVCCCLPWEDSEAWQAKWDDADEDEDGDD